MTTLLPNSPISLYRLFVTYAAALNEIANEDPEVVKSAPHSTSVRRVDDVLAAKNAILSYRLLKEYEKKEG